MVLQITEIFFIKAFLKVSFNNYYFLVLYSLLTNKSCQKLRIKHNVSSCRRAQNYLLMCFLQTAKDSELVFLHFLVFAYVKN